MDRRRLRPMGGCAAVLIGCAALLGGAADADAKSTGFENAVKLRFPSDELTEGGFRSVLQPNSQLGSVTPTVITIAKGTHRFDSLFFAFDRSNVTICGATGRASDVVLEFANSSSAFQLQQTKNFVFRDLTIRFLRNESPGNNVPEDGVRTSTVGFRLNAKLSEEFAGFVDETRIESCNIEAAFPIVATAGTTRLTVNRSKLTVTQTDGFGIVWGDGEGLLVSRTRFASGRDPINLENVLPFSGIFVQGAQAAFSEGERARQIILTRNKLSGEFLRGFDLADVREVRVRRNRFNFSGDAIRDATSQTGLNPSDPTNPAAFWGRVGILIRRGDSSALPEDYEIRKNTVRGAYYGTWLFNCGAGSVVGNDFKRCGSSDRDGFFNSDPELPPENGGGLRLTLQGPCRINVESNDMRNLKSPKDDALPAITVLPAQQSDDCFLDPDPFTGDRVIYNNRKNKTSGSRKLVLAEPVQ